MIFLLGPSDDSTTRYFAHEAARQAASLEWVDLSAAVAGRWHVEVDGGFELWAGNHLVVPPGSSVYARLMTAAPGGDGITKPSRERGLLVALTSWLELAGGRIVNRPGHALDNASKPLHEVWLREAGFLVPASVTSSDPRKLRKFVRAQPAVVKTISGVRADCRRICLDDLDRFHPEQGPIHLQRFVGGKDVRVHVIGNRAIAVGIRSRAVDYRAAADAHYSRFELPQLLSQRLVDATASLGLTFAGWDFKVSDDDGLFYALEVNPMPGYHIYDDTVDGEITRALVGYLEGRE